MPSPVMDDLKNAGVPEIFDNLLSNRRYRNLLTMGKRARASLVQEARNRFGGLPGRSNSSALGKLLTQAIQRRLAGIRAGWKKPGPKPRPRPSGDHDPLPDWLPPSKPHEYTVVIKIVPVDGGDPVTSRIIIDADKELSTYELEERLRQLVSDLGVSAEAGRKLVPGAAYQLYRYWIISVAS